MNIGEIIVNGQRVPVSITEMEKYFDLKSNSALNDKGLNIIYNMTNSEGKANWLILQKKHNRPAQNLNQSEKTSFLTKIPWVTISFAAVLIVYLINRKK